MWVSKTRNVRFSLFTRFSVRLQNKLHVLVALFTIALFRNGKDSLSSSPESVCLGFSKLFLG